MRTMLDCESVFEVLTQGPFPQGAATDEAVAAHLQVCHECRELAEALRPAVGLLHESLREEPNLPRFDGVFARTAAPQFTRLPRWETRGWLALSLLAVLLGVYVWRDSGRTAERSAAGAAGSSVALGTFPSPAAWGKLSRLPIPNACRRGWEGREADAASTPGAEGGFPFQVAARAVISPDEWRWMCCTACHHVGGRGPMTQLVLNSFAIACSTCHVAT